MIRRNRSEHVRTLAVLPDTVKTIGTSDAAPDNSSLKSKAELGVPSRANPLGTVP